MWLTEFLGNRIGRMTLDLDTTPPVLTVPSEAVITDGVGVDGARVSYTVSALDDVDGLVAVACTPASGSLFAIGETTVRCSAVDAAGNVAEASFFVRVRGADAQLARLRAEITAIDATRGIVKSLDAKLEAVQAALAAANAGERQDACNKLNAFVHAVQAQLGKQLEPAEAERLLAAALRIEGLLSPR